jgi:hypothetical protein
MAKTNYTKVEEALTEGIRKIEVNKLLTEADENAAAKTNKPIEPKKSDALLLRRLTKIDQELQALQKQGNDPYVRLQIDKEEMKKFLNDPSSLTSADWDKVKLIKEKIMDYKAALEGIEPKGSDDDLIDKQRKDQKTKRFNINKKWIPLQ